MAITKNTFFLSVILFSNLLFQNAAFAKIEVVLGDLTLEENPNLALDAPETSDLEIIISRDQYVLSYNKEKRVPNWVAWKLEADQIGDSGRSNNFKIDSELDNYLTQNSFKPLRAVTQAEYKGSCFDRGHVIPSADRTDTIENNKSTFFMSNMTPQTPFLNRVIWAHLEQYTRDLVQKEGKKAYIIAGPIYDEDFGAIGPDHDIQVPSKEFKVIFVLDADQGPEDINEKTEVISVIMPNTLQDGSNPMENKEELCKPLSGASQGKNDWVQYKTSIEEVENLSGLDIIP
jgi:endonuclease G